MPLFRRVLMDALAVFLTVNVGACAVAALLALGGAFSPRLDVLAHFATLYVTGAVVGGLLIAPFRHWGRPLILSLAAVAILASAGVMAPEFLRSRPARAAPDMPGQVRIVQYNALRTNADLDREVAWLVAQKADFITVQEARPDLRDRLASEGGFSLAGQMGDLMIFSRVAYHEMVRPPSPSYARLNYVNGTYLMPGGPIEIVTVHMPWPTQPDYRFQLETLRNVVLRRPRERMILTGDFNAAPWSEVMREADRTFGVTRRDRALATYPADRRGFRWPVPILPIDHVFAGPGWATVKVERGPRLGSDHYPVVVTLAPVSPPRAGP